MRKLFRNRKGFSLPELLAIITIMAVLSLFGYNAGSRQIRNMKIYENDNTAREIFLAAQNHLTANWATGELEGAIKTKDSSYFGSEGLISTNSLDSGHEFFWLDSSSLDSDEFLDKLLPLGSIDDTVRVNGGYIISYDRKLAQVYDVFYIDCDNSNSTLQKIVTHAKEIRQLVENNDMEGRRNFANRYGEFYVGYYGVGEINRMPDEAYIAPEIIVHNDENLYLEIIDYNWGRYPDGVLTIEYLGVPSGAEASLLIPVNDNSSTPYATLLARGEESSFYARHVDDNVLGIRTYYILLDSLTTTATGEYKGQFINHFKKIDSRFHAGEDLIISATLHSATAMMDATATEQTNSLFAFAVDEGEHTYSVGISNPRHLQNLSYEVSGTNIAPTGEDENSFRIIKASMTNDINWGTYFTNVKKSPDPTETNNLCADWQNEQTFTYETGVGSIYFYPISSGVRGTYHTLKHDFEFDGKGHSIYNLNIKAKQDPGSTGDDLGLIGDADAGAHVIIRNVSLVDPIARTVKGNFVGSFIGSIRTSTGDTPTHVEIDNCHAYSSTEAKYAAAAFDMDKSIANNGTHAIIYSTSSGSGGLVGAVRDNSILEINNSSATIPVYNQSSVAGGIIAYVTNTSTLIMKNTYAGGYTSLNSGKYKDYGTDAVGVFGGSYSGGLVGYIINTAAHLEIDNCFSMTSVLGKSGMGGVIGYYNGSSSVYRKITNVYSGGRVFYNPALAETNNKGAFTGTNLWSYTIKENNYFYDYSSGLYEDSDYQVIETDSNATPLTYADLALMKDKYNNTLSYSYDSQYPFKSVNSNWEYDYVGDWPYTRSLAIEPIIINGNDLKVSFMGDAAESYFSLRIHGKVSNNDLFLLVRRDENGNVYGGITDTMTTDRNASIFNTRLPLSYAEYSSTDDEWTFYLNLDNPVISKATFGYLFCQEGNLYPGEDIGISISRGLVEPSANVFIYTNSLFAYNADKPSNSDVYIESARHLINLESIYSGVSDSTLKITNAHQIADIRWNSGSKLTNQTFNSYMDDVATYLSSAGQSGIIRTDVSGGTYNSVHSGNKLHPILNDVLVDYDGNGYFLDSFDIYSLNSNNSGLFAFNSGAAIKNIKNLNISNFTSTSSNGGAGLLVSVFVSTKPTIENIAVSGTNTVTGKDNSGLLVASIGDSNSSFKTISISGTNTVTSTNKGAGLLTSLINNENINDKLTISDITVSGNLSINGVNYESALLGDCKNIKGSMSNITYNTDIALDSKVTGILFSDLTGGSDLSISNIVINNPVSLNSTAGLAGIVSSRLNDSSNIRITGITIPKDVIVSATAEAGGITGYTGPSAKLELTNIDISGENFIISTTASNGKAAAGLVANSAGILKITNLQFLPDNLTITSIDGYAGGIVGNNNKSATLDTIKLGDEDTVITVIGQKSSGGVVGYVGSSLTTSNSFDIEAKELSVSSTADYAGGFTGYAKAGLNFTNMNFGKDYSKITVNASKSAGGIAGQTNNSTVNIYNLAFTGDEIHINGAGEHAGGIIGISNGAGYKLNINDSLIYANDLSITSLTHCGGVIGRSNSGTEIHHVLVTGETALIQSGETVGGLVGDYKNTSINFIIENSAYAGIVRATSYHTPDKWFTGVGGLVGKNSASKNFTISNSYYGGRTVESEYDLSSYNVSSVDTSPNGIGVGGIIGVIDGANTIIDNCYSSGSVSGEYAGGIAGYTVDDKFSIKNSYVFAPVHGNKATGILIGHIQDVSKVDVIENNFYEENSYDGINIVGNKPDLAYATAASAASVGIENNPFAVTPTENNAYRFDTTLGHTYPYKTVNTLDLNDNSYEHVGDWTDPSIVISFDLDDDSVVLYVGQMDSYLPKIVKNINDVKLRISPEAYTWTSSDTSVVNVNGNNIIAENSGNATLSTTIDGRELSFEVEVIENPNIDDFDVSGDSHPLSGINSKKWITVMPDDLDEDSVRVTGNRIVQEGNSFFYLSDAFNANWSDLVANVGYYQSELNDDGYPIAVKLNNTITFGDTDFDENGLSKFEMLPGDIYTDGESIYAWISNDSSGYKPDIDDEGWVMLVATRAGANHGPGSDALEYPDSIYNPYPGTINSNCTYAVWYLANHAVGARLPNWGDAGNWFRRAQISGYPVGNTPRINSIQVLDHHVAYVSDVSEDGTQIYIQEGNIQKRYIEGWWNASSRRLGMEIYGYIYLTDENGEAPELTKVLIEEGMILSESEFLSYLEENELYAGDRKEEYSEEIEEGYIISYDTGQFEVGTPISYTVSKGKYPRVIIEEEYFAGKTVDEITSLLAELGLEIGEITEQFSEELDEGIVISHGFGEIIIGDKVDIVISTKTEPEVVEDNPEVVDDVQQNEQDELIEESENHDNPGEGEQSSEGNNSPEGIDENVDTEANDDIITGSEDGEDDLILITNEILNQSEELFLRFLEDNGLVRGEITEVESDVGGIVISTQKDSYKKGDTVNYSVTVLKEEESEPEEQIDPDSQLSNLIGDDNSEENGSNQQSVSDNDDSESISEPVAESAPDPPQPEPVPEPIPEPDPEPISEPEPSIIEEPIQNDSPEGG